MVREVDVQPGVQFGGRIHRVWGLSRAWGGGRGCCTTVMCINYSDV